MGRRKKTHEEFVNEVNTLVGDEYEVISEYHTTSSKICILHMSCGGEYQARPRDFLEGRRCPKCFGKFKKTTEVFKEEVYNLVEGEYEVLGEYRTASSKIEMLHRDCKHVYEVRPQHFLRGSRCPKCFGKFKKTTEVFKEDVYKLVGQEYQVIGDYQSSLSKIGMLHRDCGNVYSVTPGNFLMGVRCPKCKESKGERKIAEWLSSRFIIANRQEAIRYERGKKPLKLDFMVQGVAIEYDGEYHYEPKTHSGGEEGLRDQQRRDRIKDKYCADNGIPLIRIPYWDFDNIDAILTEKLLPILK